MPRGDEPSTDLRIIRLGVEALTQEVRVQGSIQTRTQADTNGALWSLSGRQEDALAIANGRLEGTRSFVLGALHVVAEARHPKCKWFQVTCRRGKAQREAALKTQVQTQSAEAP